MIIRIKPVYAVAVVVLTAVTILSLNCITVQQASSKLDTARLPVVMYHQLTVDESKAGRYVLMLEQFEKDLIYLKEKGYSTVTTKDLLDFANGKGDIPEKAVMITFDDGCETVYEYALPLLEKHGFGAVCFVVGALADKYTKLNDHNLIYSNLNWSEIKELSEGNIIEIQSHSYDAHHNADGRSGMKKKKSETIEQYGEFLSSDAAKMKKVMLDNTGRTPIAIAYPFGSYSKEGVPILKKCGVKMAFTCEEKVNIIKKADSEWLFGIGRYNRANGISSESFFEKMGIC